MSSYGWGAGRNAPRPLFRSALLLTGILVASASSGQEREPAEPYRFYGGEVDRTTKDPAVEACEYRLLVEERRCNETLNKSACIARVHEECRADPDGEGEGRVLTHFPGRPRRQGRRALPPAPAYARSAC